MVFIGRAKEQRRAPQGLIPALKSDNRIVSAISATEASKRFADLLDAVEHRGESFI
ncbi:MAG TPA: hypothetical protein VFG79_10750 [Solirubrobacter sp.]|nr:hypothetical protein [Solirubrobacter sp.]